MAIKFAPKPASELTPAAGKARDQQAPRPSPDKLAEATAAEKPARPKAKKAGKPAAKKDGELF